MSTVTTCSNGDMHWRNARGQLHREDGPAIICVNGDKRWYMNDMRHRGDGPAIEHANGEIQWWYKNIFFDDVHAMMKMTAEISEDNMTILLLKYGR